MKTVVIFILIGFSIATSSFGHTDKKEKRARQQLEMAQLVESGKFRFVAGSVDSELGIFNNLSSGYEIEFDSTKVKAFLPYYGRVYSVQYGGNGAVNFELNADRIVNEWNERKKMYTITTTLSDTQDTYSIRLSIGLSGYSDLQINFRNRRWINYHGTIEKIMSENQ